MVATFLIFAFICASYAQSSAPYSISCSWSSEIRALKTVPAFQTVVNPVTCRESPYHDAVYDKIAKLGANYQRYVPWLPYPRLGIVELEPPSHGGMCGFVSSGGAGNIWSTTLDCGAQGAGTIDKVVFADYGKPTGYCNNLKADTTCTKDVSATVAAACVGKASCTLLSDDATFGTAPCGGNRLAVEVTCSDKSVDTFTYWNFDQPDEGMIDFLTAADSSNRSTIPNFSTIPNWLFSDNTDRTYFPDDPLGETWGYERGKVLADPTLQALGDYYGRLVAHYVEPGGFLDEAGRRIPGVVGGPFVMSHWEVLNEIEFEHNWGVEEYTRIYDAIVSGIHKWAPTGSKNMKFVALALGNSGNTGYAQYFLNASNHNPTSTPIDMISFHHYAGASSRDGGDNSSDYGQFFPSGDAWLNQVAEFIAIRDALNPSVLLDADEVGVILPDDNDAKYTSGEPGFPAIYWNAAGSMYAYLYGTTSVLGLDVLGESQLIGYPSIPFTRGAPYNGNWTAPPQFPSVSLLSWGGAFGQMGDGTARYWSLKLLIDTFAPGAPAGSAAAPDVLVNTTVTGGGVPVSSPFCAEVLNLDTMSFFCQTGVINAITFASYGTPVGTCGSWSVGACNAANSTAIVEGACLGKSSCSIDADTPVFGDPCYNTVKHLAVEATCSTGGGAQKTSSSPVYAQGYLSSSGLKKVLVVNKASYANQVSVPGVGAAGATWTFIDESTAYGPANVTTLSSDVITLAPYAWGVITW
jgi:hypothetical protein